MHIPQRTKIAGKTLFGFRKDSLTGERLAILYNKRGKETLIAESAIMLELDEAEQEMPLKVNASLSDILSQASSITTPQTDGSYEYDELLYMLSVMHGSTQSPKHAKFQQACLDAA